MACEQLNTKWNGGEFRAREKESNSETSGQETREESRT
jgi:hypothetical protein